MKLSAFDVAAIRDRIEQVALTEGEHPPAVARDVAFHMTDWLGDLDAFVSFCRHPASLPSAEVDRLLTAFLMHVPNHIAAASKLYHDVPVRDVFGVGAVEP